MKNWEECVEVRDSGIHGLGIFATADIPRESLIMEIRGEVINETECMRREEEGNVYIFWNDNSYIDTINTDKIKYINHHCDPNCYVNGDPGEDFLLLMSARDIKKGEEITIDYGYEEIYDTCNCSACQL